MTKSDHERERIARMVVEAVKASQPPSHPPHPPHPSHSWDHIVRFSGPVLLLVGFVGQAYLLSYRVGESEKNNARIERELGDETAKVRAELKGELATTKAELLARIAVVEAARVADHDKLIEVVGKEASLREMVLRNEQSASTRAAELSKQVTDVAATVRAVVK